MDRLNEILRELGISKVKLAKFLGVSRQMVYNYLELDDINKWPKDKKVLLLNLLGVKNSNEIDTITVDTDYILAVESRLSNLINNSKEISDDCTKIYDGLGKKQKDIMKNIIDIMKEELEDDSDDSAYYTFKYLYNCLQSIESSKEVKYILAYIAKSAGLVEPNEFAFNENNQFTFESIMFLAMTLYNSGKASKSKIEEAHNRFVEQIEHKIEERYSRTMELNTAKIQALKELGYTEITESNAKEVFNKIAEIQSRQFN